MPGAHPLGASRQPPKPANCADSAGRVLRNVVAHLYSLALIEVETLSMFRGSLPRRALAPVLEWAALHRTELREDWRRARDGETLSEIEPLD